jgi:pimeloyl-ACP methyl ester carboxylesterase
MQWNFCLRASARRFRAAGTRIREAITAVMVTPGLVVTALVMPGLVLTALVVSAGAGHAADENDPHHLPVKVVADQRLLVTGEAGAGILPLYVTGDWSKPEPEVTRVILVFHGLLRDADVYLKSSEKALSDAGDAGRGTLLVVPQFLADLDIPAHGLPPDTLRWSREGWMEGAPAHGPAPVSSFEAIDAILTRVSDRQLFPNLKTVVVAGHSGGGQVVQRYAVVGKNEAALTAEGIHVRYVVANPSSYVYFSADRPLPAGGTGPFAGAAACPMFNDWKYGFDAPPPYLAGSGVQALESRYVTRDVIYLLGTADTNPNHPVLDKSCSGEAEGPYRFARGHAYFAYLQARHPSGLAHHLWEVDGVGHDGGKMFGSACGLAALFDKPGCTSGSGISSR